MDEQNFIEKQSLLIDKLIEKNKNDNKYDKIKDCFIALLIAIVAAIFLIGYWSSDYEYNYVGSNNTVSESSSVNVEGGEE